jgi:hypothetical protein
MYINDYYISVHSSFLASKNIRTFIPVSIKSAIKKILSNWFPLKYG